jgi:N6-L-threonylcarbamoyladenine synthase
VAGGTTELLLVKPYKTAVVCEIIGGTTDVSAGQLIDRTGQLLGLSFPAGRALDLLASKSESGAYYEPKTDGLSFSLSGIEHKMKKLVGPGARPEDIALYTLRSLVAVIRHVTDKAQKMYGSLPVLFSGGVASNSLLRRELPGGIFAEPRYSVDNALGIAILTYRAARADG